MKPEDIIAILKSREVDVNGLEAIIPYSYKFIAEEILKLIKKEEEDDREIDTKQMNDAANSCYGVQSQAEFSEIEKVTHTYIWKNNPKRLTLTGRACTILARGKMNSCLIEFSNGQREIVSRYAVRKQPAK